MTRKIYYKRPDRVGLDFISSDATTFGELKKRIFSTTKAKFK